MKYVYKNSKFKIQKHERNIIVVENNPFYGFSEKDILFLSKHITSNISVEYKNETGDYDYYVYQNIYKLPVLKNQVNNKSILDLSIQVIFYLLVMFSVLIILISFLKKKI
jgi:hypothetical protein